VVTVVTFVVREIALIDRFTIEHVTVCGVKRPTPEIVVSAPGWSAKFTIPLATGVFVRSLTVPVNCVVCALAKSAQNNAIKWLNYAVTAFASFSSCASWCSLKMA
jgi:hypothetical protein